jgi:hypothetical protein
VAGDWIIYYTTDSPCRSPHSAWRVRAVPVLSVGKHVRADIGNVARVTEFCLSFCTSQDGRKGHVALKEFGWGHGTARQVRNISRRSSRWKLDPLPLRGFEVSRGAE